MFLKRLEIVGFKSFTERTTVEFSPGISAVVGPNGCGKSNIIDAIRWVMGEQNPRLLRTRNMEDLLFNGSVSRLPASMAEVTLTMVKDDPNRGDAQVSVTRSLYRAGDSEYMINRMPCRLKDVIRFFIEAGMGTKAYNIIEQEKVGRLIDAPPEERRLLIDEAAGITRYKEQRKESERRLDRAEQNLETLSVLMGEAGKRLAVVSKAAAKAQRWLALRAELKGLELVVSARRFLELSRNHGELLAQAQSLRDELATVEANCSQIELEADSLRLSEASQGQALENALNEFHGLKSQTDKWALEIGHLESDMEAAESSRQAALDDLANLDEESERHLGETRRLEESAANLRAESAEAEETRRELRERWVAIKAECDKLAQSRDLAYQKFFRASDDLARLGEILAGAESLGEHLKGRRRDLELEGNQADMTLNEANERLASRQRFKAALEDDLAAANETLEGFRQDRDLARAALEAEVRNLGQAEKAQAGLASRLDTLEALKDSGFGWYPDGALALLKDPDARGLVGPLAESLKVPDGYEEAAEAALGDRLGWILVNDRRAGLEALQLAREKGLGRCGFVSKASLNGKDISEALLGKLDYKTTISEDMLNSEKGFLTLDGDYLGPALMAGGGPTKRQADPVPGERQQGHSKKPSKGTLEPLGSPNDPMAPKAAPQQARGQMGLLARIKELEAVRSDLDKAEAEVAKISESVSDRRQALTLADETLATASNNQAAILGDLNAATSKIMVAVSEVKGLAIRRDALAGEIERNQKEMANCEGKRAQATADRESLKASVLQLEDAYRLASLEADSRSGEQDEIREQGLIAASRADSLSERLEGVSRELKRVNDWIDNLEGRKEGLESLAETLAAKQAELAGRIEELAAASRDLPQELARREESLKSLRQQIEGNRVLLQAKEEEAKQSRKSREQIAKKLASLERGLIESSYGFDKINDDLLKEWRVILVDPLAPAPVQLVSKSLQEGEPPMGGETMASTETDGAVEGQLSPDSQPLPGEGETSPDGQSLPGEGESSPDGQSLPGEGQGLPEQGAPGENEDVSAHEALPPPETIDPNELAGLELPEMAEATIMSLREKLSALGEISLEAIKEEAELNKSYGFQKTHYDDLVAAIADLRKSIVQLNVTCKERFKKTFTQADQKFREIFPVLFEGGEGWLRLTDETDPLECGVEIHVHPPGKKIMVMRSLSGGEKTLTSLCLIFALYLIKPSPFCLLDEADAPLDEANIDRFNRLLRNLSQASQIIMVTHNKRTMQISDTLFGVTMETPGVSRLVSVNLAEAEVLTNA